jgi:orotidine 5'-phosphate decarboxylase subfamily 2
LVASTATFTARLASVIADTGSLLCLGLDPDGIADAAAAERQCHSLLEATADSVCAVKANLAFFEQFGSAGYAVLERLREAIPADRLLILDGKRGDIDSTMSAYARALFDVLGADAITVNPLLGGDSLAPVLARQGRGVFVLARTSNPGAGDFLDRPAPAGGVPLYQRIVETAQGWDPGGGAIGFVVGATAPDAVAEVRLLAPTAPLLLPGVGAQGGALEAALSAALDGDGGAVIVSISRGISAASQGPALAAREFRDRITAVRSGL